MSWIDELDDFPGRLGLDLGPQPGGGVRRQPPFSAQQMSPKMGNVITLSPPNTALQPITQLDGLVAPYRPFPSELLLDLGADELLSRAPGSWVLALAAQYGDGSFTTSNPLNNCVARIEFGAGGAKHVVEVDAWRAIIPLPAETVRVEVFSTQLGPPPTTPVPIGNMLPVRVKGTLYRTTSGVLWQAIRTYPVWSGGTTFNVQAPPFAASYNYRSFGIVPPGTSPLLQLGTFVGQADQVDPAVIETQNRMNQFRKMPSATWVTVQPVDSVVTPGDAEYPGVLQFEIAM